MTDTFEPYTEAEVRQSLNDHWNDICTVDPITGYGLSERVRML